MARPTDVNYADGVKPGSLRVRVRERIQIARGVSAQGFYARNLRPGELAFDVGANVGNHTAAMLAAGARVVAVEPQASLAAELAHAFPAATVVAKAASDKLGSATLLTSTNHHELATLNPAWADQWRAYAQRGSDELVALTTLDELIARHGVPVFVKVDAEGLEDKVLAGLGQAVAQVLFEVHDDLPEVAERAFERLEQLGRFEYRLMERESWLARKPVTAEVALASLPACYGNVHARRRG